MVSRLMPYTLNAYGLSDMGLIRQNNEDVWGSAVNGCAFVLADGMGGHQAGEVASKEAVQFFLTRLQEASSNPEFGHYSSQESKDFITQTIEQTNEYVYKLGQKHELLRGMGTTFCCVYFQDDFVIYAHVGDSRIYRFRNHIINQLTDDHSLLRELMQRGRVSEKQADDFLYKNIITRAIGTEPTVEPSVEVCQVNVGDTFLLCSDGLSDLLTSQDIQEILNQTLTIEEKVRSLIAAAKRRGGYDNVTVVLVEVREQNAKEDLSR